MPDSNPPPPFEQFTLGVVCSLPKPWPTNVRLSSVRRYDKGQQVEVSYTPLGRISVRVRNSRGSIHWRSQVIQPQGEVHTIFVRGTEFGEISLNVDGVEIGKGTDDSRIVEVVGGPPIEEHSPLDQDLAARQAVTQEERFFLESMDDLRKRLASGTRYDILRAAAIVRQFLLDQPLVHRVNRRHRLEILFRVAFTLIDRDAPVAPAWQAAQIFHRSAFSPAARELTLDEFLGQEVMIVRDRPATVRDVISAGANALGGVHLGSPRREGERLATDADEEIFQGEESVAILILAAIFRVVYLSLIPLAMRVRG